MNNKIILITGTNAGIGKSIVKLLENDDLRCKTASAGYNESFKNHLAIDRVNYILNIISG